MKKIIITVLAGIVLGTVVFLNSCSSTLRIAPTRNVKNASIIQASNTQISVMRIGYATVLIRIGKDNLLIDPWFSEKAAYYHGKDSLAMRIESLPSLTAVLTSQDHYDHFDIETLAKYKDKNVPLLVCSGSKQKEKAQKLGFTNVIEPGNYEFYEFGQYKITSFESKTDEKPTNFDYERNYIIETNGKIILYVGHIMQEKVQEEISKRFPKIDLVFLPVNNLRIKINFNEQKAFSPSDATKLCEKLKPTIAIPIHYNFKGSWLTNTILLRQNGTPEQFAQLVKNKNLITKVHIVETGQWIEL